MKKMLLVMLAALTVVSCEQIFDEYQPRVETTYPDNTEEEEPGPEPKPDPKPGEVTVDPDSYWYQAADSASMELLNRYWPPKLSKVTPQADVIGKWHFAATQDYKTDPNNNYWHQPHALDAIIDAYNRTPTTEEYAEEKAAWLEIFDKWFQGVPRFHYQWNENWAATQWTSRFPWAATTSADGWRNHFIDDMEWQVMTQIRMYEALKVNEPDLAAKYLAKAREIYDLYIWEWAWDDVSTSGGADGGGVFWMRDTAGTSSKNACSNGPALVIAAKLAYIVDDTEAKAEYRRQAELIYEWMTGHLWNTNGSIADNWSNGNKNGGALTYNQGTFIGGSHWLYKVTGDYKYLTSAIMATEYTIDNMQAAGDGGVRILNSESGATEGNNSVFRAIFLRYFVEMINEPAVDEDYPDVRDKWYTNLENWANYVWRDGKGIDKGTGVTNPGELLFGYDWKKQLTASEISAGVNLGNMVSGAVLVESMNIAIDPTPDTE
jgi:predicted alpha-1,6-mannanase (GH76 family)